MPCFWENFVDTFDPTCGDAPPGHLYTQPALTDPDGSQWGGGSGIGGEPVNFNDGLFSDNTLTTPVTATTAQCTNLKVYDGVFSNCEMVCWASCVLQLDVMTSTCYPTPCTDGADPEAPPIGTELANYDVALTFDPTGVFPFADAYAAMPVIDGTTHASDNCIVVATVVTDLGTTIYVFANSTCF
jgi:hypothetical protein